MSDSILDLLQQLSKERKKKYSDADLQEKIRLSSQQIEELEKGNLYFTVYPFNYHHTKTYVQLLKPSAIDQVSPDHFQSASLQGISPPIDQRNADNIEENNDIDFKNFFHKIKKYFHG
jgi:hypothetical protein